MALQRSGNLQVLGGVRRRDRSRRRRLAERQSDDERGAGVLTTVVRFDVAAVKFKGRGASTIARPRPSPPLLRAGPRPSWVKRSKTWAVKLRGASSLPVSTISISTRNVWRREPSRRPALLSG